MIHQIRKLFSTIIAFIAGGIILLGYFLKFDLLLEIRNILFSYAVILSAVALIIGITNLVLHNIHKIDKKETGYFYSMIILVSLGLTIIILGYFGITSAESLWLFNYIQIPIESSLLAILAVVLIYALIRLLQRRGNIFSIIFVAVVLLVLISSVPIFEKNGSWLFGSTSIFTNLINVVSVAGMRGIFIGIALGIITTGLRILLGLEKPIGD